MFVNNLVDSTVVVGLPKIEGNLTLTCTMNKSVIITLVCGFRCNVGDSNGTGLNDFRSGVGDAIGVQIGGAGGCGGLLSLSPFKESCEPQTPLTTNIKYYRFI